ncbi:MAG TPA: NUDIX domain-containing protein, partial [archaeon]|nr:NUDIX domain-containing protein [archaeon]
GIIVRNGRIVLVNQAGKSWSFPKGHVERGETLLTAARREIREECGLVKIELVKELAPYKRVGRKNGKKEMKSLHFFLFTAKEEKLKPIDKAITEARWVDIDKVAEILTNEKDKEFFLRIKSVI